MAPVSVCAPLSSSSSLLFDLFSLGFMKYPREEEVVAGEGTSDTILFALEAALDPEGAKLPRL